MYTCHSDPAEGNCDAHNVFGGPGCTVTHVKLNTNTSEH